MMNGAGMTVGRFRVRVHLRGCAGLGARFIFAMNANNALPS
jgi:hypothetical protein